MEGIPNDSEKENDMKEIESLKSEAKLAAQRALKLVDETGEVNNPETQNVNTLNEKIWTLQRKWGIKEE